MVTIDGGGYVLERVECFFDVSWHEDIQYACIVIPVQSNATVNTPCLILCYLILFLECICEAMGFLLSLIYDSKVVDN